MAARDVLGAIITLLKADSALSALVSTRVYGEELPADQDEHMPRPAVVIRHSPGLGGIGGTVELERLGFNVYCFGETPARADSVRRAVQDALKYTSRTIKSSTLMHSFEEVGTAQSLRDADTNWPYMISSWRCLASEIAAT